MSESSQNTPNAPTNLVEPRGEFPSKAHQFKVGGVGNPAGRPSAGATIKEHINALCQQELSEKELRSIARDKELPWPRRAAANRILRTLEIPDLADFQEAVDGSKDLQTLRNDGVNTEVVKKIKTRTKTYGTGEKETTEVEREIELHDRAGEDFDRVMDRTDGKPTQAVKHEGGVKLEGMAIEFLGLPDAPKP